MGTTMQQHVLSVARTHGYCTAERHPGGGRGGNDRQGLLLSTSKRGGGRENGEGTGGEGGAEQEERKGEDSSTVVRMSHLLRPDRKKHLLLLTLQESLVSPKAAKIIGDMVECRLVQVGVCKFLCCLVDNVGTVSSSVGKKVPFSRPTIVVSHLCVCLASWLAGWPVT